MHWILRGILATITTIVVWAVLWISYWVLNNRHPTPGELALTYVLGSIFMSIYNDKSLKGD